MESDEIWVPISGYEGRYSVSNYGRVYSHITNRIRKQVTAHHGYKRIQLRDNGCHRTFFVHRLVAEAFLQKPSDAEEVNHKNKDTSDNRVDNLEWCTRDYNLHYDGGLKKEKHSVAMINQDGIIVGVFESQLSASKQTGVGQGAISNACSGRAKTAGGFYWKETTKGGDT